MAATIVGITTLAAQNYMVVDSKKIFESYPTYTNAISTLEREADSYQKKVDAKFNNVEQQYNSYMKIKSQLSKSQQKQREATIQNLENEATQYQTSIFGDKGIVSERQKSVLEPIQKKVMTTIENYAKSHGFDLVMDSATSPSILYRSKNIERTNAIIKQLK